MFCKNDSGMHARPAVGLKWPMCQELKRPMCQESCRRWTKVVVLFVDNLFDLFWDVFKEVEKLISKKYFFMCSASFR